jgi:hypothetical protein
MGNGETWIQSASNTKIDFKNPDPDSFKIEDIALGLARQPRYAGQGNFFYSVAQHSIYVATQVEPKLRLHGLLHDAHEAYMGDIPGPLKALLPEINEIEYRMDRAIYRGLKLSPPSHKQWCKVMAVDRGMLNIESAVLFDENMWRIDDVDDIHVRIIEMSEEEVFDFFLAYYHSLRDRDDKKYGYIDHRQRVT